jgi:DNA-directed RNA polymerase specialized sigma subunit
LKAKTKDTIAYLKQPQKLDVLIKNKLIERQQLKDIALSITGHSDGERVQSSGSKHKMADAIDKCVDMDAEINRLVDSLIDCKKEVIATIEQLNTTEYDVLHKLYIQHMTFDDVAVEKNRSKSWVTTVHGRALTNVQKILDKKE